MKSKIYSLCLLLICSGVAAQHTPRQSFDDLRKGKFADAQMEFWYNPATTTIINVATKKAGKELLKQVEYFNDEYYGESSYIIAKTKLVPGGDDYYVIYNGSWDEKFHFIRPYAEKPMASLWPGTLLVVPSNGAVYTSDHTANFTARHKYEFVGDSLVGIKQPYLYVGLKTHTLKEVKIYQTKDKQKVIATLPPNYEIEVLLAEREYGDGWSDFYLVRTSFGICGWAELRYGQYESIDVEGLSYNND